MGKSGKLWCNIKPEIQCSGLNEGSSNPMYQFADMQPVRHYRSAANPISVFIWGHVSITFQPISKRFIVLERVIQVLHFKLNLNAFSLNALVDIRLRRHRREMISAECLEN